jgi:hypothetical protein
MQWGRRSCCGYYRENLIVKKFLSIFFLIIFQIICSAQSDTTVWNEMKKVEGTDYNFSVPSKWREMNYTSSGLLNYYEASGLAFPLTYNDNPVIVITCIVKMEDKKNIEEVKESIQRGYKNNKDRVFPENFSSESEELTLKSGEKAYLINTRFFRTSKGLNQSRFDLGTFSEKTGTAYMYTISIQYKDDTYEFEEYFKLKDFARKLYSYFSYKQ